MRPPAAFQLSVAELRDLARGRSSPAVLDVLASGRRSKNLALLRALVDAAAGPSGAATVQALELLKRAETAAPQAVARILAHPVVGAWLARAVLRPGSGAQSDGTTAGRLGVLAAAAGHVAGIEVRIVLPVTSPGLIAIPTLGVARVPAGTTEARFETGEHSSTILAGRTRLIVPVSSGIFSRGSGWRPERALHLTGPIGWTVRIDDTQWLRIPAELRLPGGSGAVGGGQLRWLWEPRLRAGWRLLAEGHPAAAAEVREIFAAVLPIAAGPSMMRSSTFRDAFGLIAMSAPTVDPRTTAVTLAHEVQHAKLSALMDLFPLIRAGRPDLFFAPWRNELRPATNLLHGAYAHLTVARFWHRQRQLESSADRRRRADESFRQWSTATGSAITALEESEVLTDLGHRFVGWMREPLEQWLAGLTLRAGAEDDCGLVGR